MNDNQKRALHQHVRDLLHHEGTFRSAPGARKVYMTHLNLAIQIPVLEAMDRAADTLNERAARVGSTELHNRSTIARVACQALVAILSDPSVLSLSPTPHFEEVAP